MSERTDVERDLVEGLTGYVEQLKRENRMSGGSFEVDAERWCELNDELDRLRAELKQADDALAVAKMANQELREWLYARTPGETRIVVTKGEQIVEAIESRDLPTYTAMATVLAGVEWSCLERIDDQYCPMCPACCATIVANKHKPDCPLGRALGRQECSVSAAGGEGT